VEIGRGPTPTIDGREQAYYTGFLYAGRLSEAPNLVMSTGGTLLVGPAGLTLAPPIVGHDSNGKSSGSTGLSDLPSLPLPALPTLPVLAAGNGRRVSVGTGVVLQPARTARRPADGRAVIWADDVSLSDSAGGYYRFAHARRGAKGGPMPLSYTEPRGCRGQHRAHADGSVDWVSGEDLGMNAAAAASGMTPDATASYRMGQAYWWF
jgi:hypothetical protein